ncbi:hypothetical protein D5S18_22055 [Nocardia panacis]|uniref:Uncharacterized protein n=1 Tax=Nocardia panacis TaxID=2340916 RepID=A0A3A4KFB6_9NOCA|nr:hypothetical protein D5S18_22055 [Nocardia panacis]
MHAVLDVAEVLWTEHMGEKELVAFNRDMYRIETLTAAGELAVVPAGFERDDEMADFDAFAQMAGE